jgi:hypothetical protein
VLKLFTDVGLGMKFFAWQNAGIAVQYITTQGKCGPNTDHSYLLTTSTFVSVILELRLYAMYGKSKRILAFLICLTSAEITVMVCIFSIPRAGLVGEHITACIPFVTLELTLVIIPY